MLEVGSGPQVPTFRNSTYLDPQVGLTRDLGARQPLGKRCSLGRNGISKLYLFDLFTRKGDSFLCEYVDYFAKAVAMLQALRTTMKEFSCLTISWTQPFKVA